MPLTSEEMLNLLDLEKQLATRIREGNKTLPLEANAPLWFAEQVSLQRIAALTAILSDVGVVPPAG